MTELCKENWCPGYGKPLVKNKNGKLICSAIPKFKTYNDGCGKTFTYVD